jgi:flagellar protein FliL
MAEAEKPKDSEGEAEESVAPKKSKKKLIIIAVISIVVLALVAGGAFFMMGKKKGGEGADGAEVAEAEHEEKAHDQPPVYVKLDAFTTNLAAEDTAPPGTAGQYIQVVVELKVEDAKEGEEIKNYMPEIKNNILRLLSSKFGSQLATTDGKDALANEIRDSVNGVINPGSKKDKGSHGPVTSVLFSSFIIQ